MLIASKFHDYYDSIRAYGVDRSVVYIRSESRTVLDETLTPYQENFFITRNRERFVYEVQKHIIGFCGNLYPVVEFRRVITDGPNKSKFFYDIESLREFMDSLRIRIQRGYSYWGDNYQIKDEASLEKFFSATKFQTLKQEFRRHNTPVFIVGRLDKDKPHDDILVCNPILRHLQFQKVKDPFTAFQDIFSYISGVLGVGERPMVKVSDKTKAAKAGHDGKYSFRRPPKEKKK
jgi:hypothetical protein